METSECSKYRRIQRLKRQCWPLVKDRSARSDHILRCSYETSTDTGLPILGIFMAPITLNTHRLTYIDNLVLELKDRIKEANNLSVYPLPINLFWNLHEYISSSNLTNKILNTWKVSNFLKSGRINFIMPSTDPSNVTPRINMIPRNTNGTVAVT